MLSACRAASIAVLLSLLAAWALSRLRPSSDLLPPLPTSTGRPPPTFHWEATSTHAANVARLLALASPALVRGSPVDRWPAHRTWADDAALLKLLKPGGVPSVCQQVDEGGQYAPSVRGTFSFFHFDRAAPIATDEALIHGEEGWRPPYRVADMTAAEFLVRAATCARGYCGEALYLSSSLGKLGASAAAIWDDGRFG